MQQKQKKKEQQYLLITLVAVFFIIDLYPSLSIFLALYNGMSSDAT